jgi:hypothetical protein
MVDRRDNAEARLKRQIMGREVVVRSRKGSSILAHGNKSFMVSSTVAGEKEPGEDYRRVAWPLRETGESPNSSMVCLTS